MSVSSVSPPTTSDGLSTNAVTRNLSNLHTPTWLALLAANITTRTLIFHPIQLAISRKRVTREDTAPTVWHLLRTAYRGDGDRLGRGGIRSCYRGLGTALVCNLLGETSYLFTLETMKEQVTQRRTSSETSVGVEKDEAGAFSADSYSSAIGGMSGDLVSLVLVTPFVVVCNRQMTAGYGMAASNRYVTAAENFRVIWNLHQTSSINSPSSARRGWLSCRNGFQGLYQGFSAGLLRIPSSGCWWGLYTKSKEVLYTVAAPTLTRWEQDQLRTAASRGAPTATSPSSRAAFWRQNWFLSPTDNPLLNATAGIIASVITTLLFNPMAVIQTRQQSLPPRFWETVSATSSRHAEATTQTTVKTAKWRIRLISLLPFRRVYYVASDLVKREGVRGFLKGAPANITVAVFDGVIFTLLFEFTKLGSDVEFLQQMGMYP